MGSQADRDSPFIQTATVRPRVLHLACGTGKQPAGVQRHIADLSMALAAQGYGCAVACPGGSWLEAEISGKVPSIRCTPVPGGFRGDLWKLLTAVRKGNVPVIHAHNRASLRAALWLRKAAGCRVIATCHTLTPYPELARADRRIAVSQAVAQRLDGDGLTSEVIYCGVDTERFRPGPDSRGQLRQELGVPESAVLVLSISRLAKLTAVRGFLEAAAHVRQYRPDAHFALMGAGPPLCRAEALALRARLGLKGSFHLLGERSDAHRLLPGADVFAHCSQNEAFGLAAVEAMACGIPVVATRVGGLPEALGDGEAGLLAEPSAAGVAEQILSLLDHRDAAVELAAAGRRLACERFSVARSVEAHVAAYAPLCPA